MNRLAAAGFAVAAFSACSSPTASPEPSGATGVPTAPSSEGAGGPGLANLFFPGDPIAVVVNEAHVYVEPDAASELNGDAKRGDVLSIIDYAKVDDAGRLWLYVVALNSPVEGRLPDLPTLLEQPEFALQGWILALDGQKASIARLQPRCPAVVDFEHVSAMLGTERVACFGARQLLLDGISGCGPCGGDNGVYDPPWLAGDAGGSLHGNQGPASIGLYLPPPLTAPEGGTLIRVLGHVDDPRAAGCRVSLDGVELPRLETVEMCRRHFVVDALEVLPKPPPDPLE